MTWPIAEDTLPRRRISADEFSRIVEAGIVGEDERVELIDGEMVQMSPKSEVHAVVVHGLAAALQLAYGRGFSVWVEQAVRVGSASLPEPDLAVTRGSARSRLAGHPDASTCALVVEVSVSSQAHDRAKAALYARGGVPELWLVDVPQRRVTVFRGSLPEGDWTEMRLWPSDAALPVPETSAVVDFAGIWP